MVNLFAYGSLMLPAVFQQVAKRVPRSTEARLMNFKRVCVQNESYPAALPAMGEQIIGTLWLDVSEEEILQLDAFEGSDYQRVIVNVSDLAGQPYAACFYQWNRDDGLVDQPWDLDWFKRTGISEFSRKFLRQ